MPICEFGSPAPRFTSPVPPSSARLAGARRPPDPRCRLQGTSFRAFAAHPHTFLRPVPPLVWVAAPRWLPAPVPSGPPCCLPSGCRSLLLFIQSGKPGRRRRPRGALPGRAGLTAPGARPPRLRGTREQLSLRQPPFAWHFCIASHGSGKGKNMCKLLGCWRKLT